MSLIGFKERGLEGGCVLEIIFKRVLGIVKNSD